METSIKKTIAIIMGSESDRPIMDGARKILEEKSNYSYEMEIVSAHRTPKKMFEYASSAEKKGFKIIIAGAGGSAHLPGMVASLTSLPVIGVPIKSSFNDGLDSLLSIVQMPYGVPVATVGVNASKNAALLAIKILDLIK